MSITYKPLEERTPDTQYRDRLILIRDKGVEARSAHSVGSRTYMGMPPMRFDLRNGFPMTTIRKVGWKGAVGELLGFINGARTLDELVNEFGVPARFWEETVTKEKCAQFGLEKGDLGDGSYGAAMGAYPTSWGEDFNQMKHVLHQLRHQPEVRTHWVDPWIPFYAISGEWGKRKVVVAPCHGWMHWRVLNGQLHLQMHQRAADMPIGSVYNTIQYSALLIAVAHVLKREVGWFYHSFSDAHIYDNQLDPWVNELVEREPLPFPKLELTADAPNDLFAFRSRHFVLSEYQAHPAMDDIPFAV
jgi:thymidylate synthase